VTPGKQPPSLAREVVAGDRRALAKAITLLEGSRPDQRGAAAALLEELAPAAVKNTKALRVGISGPPGVGKSTFIECFGMHVLEQGHRVAVLAVDPSSPVSGGSILGDRVRMEELSRQERAFIRPSPAGVTLGGAARHTREAIIACEAAGYDVIIVETVGVGQSEVVTASMVDTFVVLAQPNAGDEIQGLKKGLVEMADLIAVTKADGATLTAARLAAEQLRTALSSSQRASGPAPVSLVSSTEGTGIAELWKALQDDVAKRRADGSLAAQRKKQALSWFKEELAATFAERLAAQPELTKLVASYAAKVESGRTPASVAAVEAIDRLLARGDKP
jgi:LAO/AO transport system kinase